MDFDPLDHSVTEALRAWRVQYGAGVSLAQTLETCASVCSPRGRSCFLQAAQWTQEGRPFEDLLRALSGVLPEGDRAALNAGWKGGRLDGVMDAAIARRELRHATRRRMRARLVLPVLILAGASFVAPLPAFILGGSALQYLVSAILPLAVAFGIWRACARLTAERAHASVSSGSGSEPAPPTPLDRAMLALPLAGKVERLRNLSDFAGLLSLLIGAGVPISEAIEICARSLPNGVYREEVERLRGLVREGRPLSDGLAQGPLWPMEFVMVLKTAEVSGDWERAFARLAADMRERYTFAIEQFAEWLPRFVYAIVCLFVISQIAAGAGKAFTTVQ